MVTIYLDKQVFSHLFKAKEEKYIRLREKILSHKDEFIFFYSDGHLLDLQNDTTNMKSAEMDFIQSIVDGNRIIYDGSKLEVIKQSPQNAFETIGKIEDFSWLENIDFSQLTEEQKNVINNIVDISVKDLKGELDFDWINTRMPISVDRVQVDKSTFTSLMKFISYNFYENKDSYKILRDDIIAKYNPKLITAENEDVFNEQLSSSPLGLSFMSLVNAVLVQTGISSTVSVMIYQVSYTLLDLFGIRKEARKKVNFRNMQVDCIHSFSGSYCDCIVSDDEGVQRKSKILYNLFKIDTKVYSIDEFIKNFDEAINNNKKSASEYFDEIIDDYRTMQILKIETTPEHTLLQLNTYHKYFGYFNCMMKREAKDETEIILYKSNDLNQSILVKEVEIIVNRFVRIFNELGDNFVLFEEVVEFPQIKADNWARFLIVNDFVDMYITKFKDIPMLCLCIKLKKNQ